MTGRQAEPAEMGCGQPAPCPSRQLACEGKLGKANGESPNVCRRMISTPGGCGWRMCRTRTQRPPGSPGTRCHHMLKPKTAGTAQQSVSDPLGSGLSVEERRATPDFLPCSTLHHCADCGSAAAQKQLAARRCEGPHSAPASLPSPVRAIPPVVCAPEPIISAPLS